MAGCSTLNKPDQVNRIGAVTYAVAKTGTAATLLAKPEYREQFTRAVYALDAMLAADRADLAEISRILSNTGISEFRSAEGLIVLEGGLAIYEITSGLFWEPASRAGTMTIITRLRDGIADGLGGTPKLAQRDPRRAYPARTPATTRRF
jgi:hypothetical protein